MTSEAPSDDLEVVSPELVLVSSAEVASRAREELPELPEVAAPVARAAPPQAAPDVVTRPAPAPTQPVAGAAAAPPPLDRAPAPAYPRVVVEEAPAEPPRRRRRGRVVLATCLVGAAVAAGGYLTETRWLDGGATPAVSAPASPPTLAAAEDLSLSVPTAPAPSREPRTTAPKPAAHPAATATQPVTTSTGPAAEQRPHTASPSTSVPEAPVGFVPARSWAWAPQQGADAYEVTFFLDGRVVLRARPTKPGLVLPSSFRFHAGRYRWTVRALPATASGALIVDSTFVLTAAAAAAANGS
jgi:hypothetical protein